MRESNLVQHVLRIMTILISWKINLLILLNVIFFNHLQLIVPFAKYAFSFLTYINTYHTLIHVPGQNLSDEAFVKIYNNEWVHVHVLYFESNYPSAYSGERYF